ncbi:MAG: asparagine synthase (glutamine-hydrolyzing) [Pyrinomonadaceae bacterium]|nr:asparagine synthase (glutamine-hydrolyzing) [Pyrinomonadaceae bacterium]
MCGIFGIHRSGDGASVDLQALKRATLAISHRGPDDEGYLLADTRAGERRLCGGPDTSAHLNLPPLEAFTDNSFDLAFGFRRLSILDLSVGGHQPMASADGKCWIVYNGEIYNYLELREELTGHGFVFKTGTDTEVILAAYQHWGVRCLEHFNGMWGFALYDIERRELFLARDPFGIKPLYYVSDNERFVFASEIKAILEAGGLTSRINARRLYEYLLSGLTDHTEETLFAGVRQLPAAHYLIVPLDKAGDAPEPKRYWQVDLRLRREDISFDEAAGELRRLFLESVRLHLRSDVQVGAALSGGIDSSAIVTAMREVEPQLELYTFSYTADDSAINEERWADIAAGAAGARRFKVQPSAQELVADLNRLIATQDEPFGSTSIYAQYRVFKLAHESSIKVMLDGQGADEMLAGYRTYLAARLGSLLKQRQWAAARRFLESAAGLPAMGRGMLLRATGGMLLSPYTSHGKLLPALSQLARRTLGNGSSLAWLNRGWFEEQGIEPPKPANGHGREMLQSELHDTLVRSSLPMLLRYEDRNSMAHSVESRVPFLTSALVEFIFALPEEYLIAPDGTSKSIFRRAMRGIVPDEILERKDKIGFATPERSWLSALKPWIEDVFKSEAAARIPALNLPHVKQEWEQILEGRRYFDFRVWRWLNLIRWAEQFKVEF